MNKLAGVACDDNVLTPNRIGHLDKAWPSTYLHRAVAQEAVLFALPSCHRLSLTRAWRVLRKQHPGRAADGYPPIPTTRARAYADGLAAAQSSSVPRARDWFPTAKRETSNTGWVARAARRTPRASRSLLVCAHAADISSLGPVPHEWRARATRAASHPTAPTAGLRELDFGADSEVFMSDEHRFIAPQLRADRMGRLPSDGVARAAAVDDGVERRPVLPVPGAGPVGLLASGLASPLTRVVVGSLLALHLVCAAYCSVLPLCSL